MENRTNTYLNQQQKEWIKQSFNEIVSQPEAYNLSGDVDTMFDSLVEILQEDLNVTFQIYVPVDEIRAYVKILISKL